MKKIISTISLLIICLALMLPAIQSFATNHEYTVLAPLPCIGNDQDCNKLAEKTTLEKYLPGMFNLLIGLAAVFAVLNIVFGGITYMSTDALQGKEDGKARIWNAVKGLVLVIGAWLILATINPDLLNLKLSVEPITVATPPAGGTLGGSGGPAGVPMTEAQIAESNRIRNMLKSPSVDILVNAGPCTEGQPSGCTNLNGLNQTLLNSTIDLRRAVGNTIVISGGTESGHSAGSSHYTGNAVDLRWAPHLDSYIENPRNGAPVQTSLGPRYTVTVNGQAMTFLKESNPPHWHVELKK